MVLFSFNLAQTGSR